MQHSVTEMGRAVRRRLERVVHKSRDKDYARRALAILHLWESEGNVAQAADRVRAARSSVYRWQSSFETYGEEGLCPQPRGRSDWKANDEVLSLLETIVGEDPRELGYLRSRSSSELLSLELARRARGKAHVHRKFSFRDMFAPNFGPLPHESLREHVLVGRQQPIHQRREEGRFAVRGDDRPRCCTQLPKPVADALEPLPLLGLVPAGRADKLSRAALALGVPLNSNCGLLAVSWDAASHRTACTLRCSPSRSCRQLMISKRLRACGLPFGLSMRIRLLGDFAVSPPSS